MPSSPVIKVVERLRKTVLRRVEDTLSDGQLLDRFLENRDEAAFAALVRRHAPMVWGVCRRIVGHGHDAEDAFQAAFLILVRKAAGVKPRAAVGNWLYGVACRTALKARTISARVRAKEKQVTSMPEPAMDPREDMEELQRLLDKELSALPDKYRLPVVLCDLESRTRKEVAAQLRIPEGTLSSRLATAHQILAKRLARHGLAVSGASLAALFAQNAAAACVPAAMVSSTIETATLVVASQGAVAGVVSTKVAALTDGVMKAMLLTKLKIATGTLLIVSLIAAGGTLLTGHMLAAQQGQAEQPAFVHGKADPQDVKLDLGKEKPAPLHYYPDEKQRALKKRLQAFEEELRKNWEKEPDATKAHLLQAGLEHYRERIKAMEEELKKLEKAWKEKEKEQGGAKISDQVIRVDVTADMFVAPGGKLPDLTWGAWLLADGKVLGLDFSRNQAVQKQIRDWYGDPPAEPGSTFAKGRRVQVKGRLEFRSGVALDPRKGASDGPVIVIESLTDLSPLDQVWPARQFTRAFLDDAESLLKKHANKAVAVEGVIGKVVVDQPGSVTLYLKGATDKVGIVCIFEAENAKDAARMKVGYTITVVGRGIDRQGADILLRSPVIGPANPVSGSEDSDLDLGK